MARTSRHGARGPAAGSETTVDAVALEAALRDAVDGEVRFDAGSRGAYATDGSNYRQVPIGVVVPRSVEAAVRAVRGVRAVQGPGAVQGRRHQSGGADAPTRRWSSTGPSTATPCCRWMPTRAPVWWSRGSSWTSSTGNCPGSGLQFGPKPSTHSHCALGGMIGNNSCGASAQAYGKTVDNVRRLEILTYDGTRMWVGPTTEAEREADRRRRAGAGPRSMPVWSASSPSTSRTSGRDIRGFRAGSPATTWTPCCRRTASTWRRPWSAARAPW